MATIKKDDMLQCRGIGSTLKCIGSKKASEFYSSYNIWGNGYTPYCKECLNKIFDTYNAKLKNEKIALYYTLMQCNVPFVAEIYNKISSKGNITVNKYFTEFMKSANKKMVWNDFSATDISLSEQESAIAINDDCKEMELNWGIQDDVSDYNFLQKTFERYTEGVEFVNPQQEDLYRDLCRDRLLLRKINDGRYGGEETIDKVQSRIAKTMSILKVDKFEEKKKKTDIERILEKQIWEIENTEPAEVVDKEEYKDYLDIHKDWGKDILRCVKNLLVNSKEFPNITRDSDKY